MAIERTDESEFDDSILGAIEVVIDQMLEAKCRILALQGLLELAGAISEGAVEAKDRDYQGSCNA